MMNSRWENSDAYYDLRTSGSEKLNDQLKELADKSVTDIDPDYLAFHHLLRGQSANHEPNQIVEQQTPIVSENPDPSEGDCNGGETLSLLSEGQQPDTRKINDLHGDYGVEMQEKRTQYTEFDRDYAVLVRSLEGEVREDDYHHFFTSDNCWEVNVEARGDTIQQTAAAVEVEPRRKMLSELDRGKAIVVETGSVTEGRKRKFVETDEGKNLVLAEIGKVGNEIEQIKMALNEFGTEESESRVEAVIENFNRNFDVVRQVKRRVVELENSMKGFSDLMALQDFETPNQRSMTEDGSAAKGVQFVVQNTGNNRVPQIESADAVEFRRCVLARLTKPFDETEYGDLTKQFRPYRPSYPDVTNILGEYRRNKAKRLNIFRGFFFYLENNNQMGSFEPWKDIECLSL